MIVHSFQGGISFLSCQLESAEIRWNIHSTGTKWAQNWEIIREKKAAEIELSALPIKQALTRANEQSMRYLLK